MANHRHCSERGRAKIPLPNQGDGRSQGQLRASKGTEVGGTHRPAKPRSRAPVHRYSRTEP
jgi:hypothetical protein